jgi:pSer/pThr/pTyr-binding forkhead associated (FHA) protein
MAMIIQTVEGVVVNRFDVEDKGIKFGRTSRNQVQIDDKAVSGDHAVIVKSVDDKGAAVYFIQDLDSTNGTFVNEKRIDQQQLHHNDSIRIGLNMFTFIDENEQNMEKTSEIKKSWIPGVYYTKDD